MTKKWPNLTKWPNAFFHGQRSLKMAKFFEIGHEMSNLATLVVSFPCASRETPFCRRVAPPRELRLIR